VDSEHGVKMFGRNGCMSCDIISVFISSTVKSVSVVVVVSYVELI
jgi:hypothetical protein